jgi:hypothetical protein
MVRDWTDSERVNKLSIGAEVFFNRLLMKADDHGGFHGQVAVLKAQLFPLRTDSIREADISRWIGECREAGLIVFYEVKSKPIVRIIDFGQRLRSMKSKFPRIPDELLPPDLIRVTLTGNDGQCRLTDGLKRREENIEVEEEGKTPAVNPTSYRTAKREDFDNSPVWQEMICKKHKRSLSELPAFFDAFFVHLQTQQKSNLPAKEAMAYFDNWLGKQPKGNKPSKNDGNGPDLSK